MEKQGKNKAAALDFMAELENYDQVAAFVDERMEEVGCGGKAALQIQIAVEEVFVNIASYAYAPGHGPASLSFWDTSEPDMVWIRFEDGGIPFDPLKKPDPDITAGEDTRPIGGLGIYMVKEFMDSVSYVYENKKNIFTFGKKYQKT